MATIVLTSLHAMALVEAGAFIRVWDIWTGEPRELQVTGMDRHYLIGSYGERVDRDTVTRWERIT
jgi:hypothetical protein